MLTQILHRTHAALRNTHFMSTAIPVSTPVWEVLAASTALLILYELLAR